MKNKNSPSNFMHLFIYDSLRHNNIQSLCRSENAGFQPCFQTFGDLFFHHGFIVQKSCKKVKKEKSFWILTFNKF